ncbi:M35 family metallopeptidase [Bradyrhizobium ontarionense]|uniref:M35 family metallopeptidase n=1 Tax=Bradyrhizobium ontarionense TaxID=2898149 RepID=A0ABY3RHW9_9BRAD|nr:M35 family metallopeptidase [Bradyrhizobium sp. A19]UFZ06352.1 M35 family metallopeptidase [Bradyrhizobium sp. A19]
MVFLLWFAPAVAQPVPCKGSDLASAKAAQVDAQNTLKAALNFLHGNDSKTKQLVKRWFGRNDQATIDQVVSVLARTSDWVGKVSLYCLYANDGSLVESTTAPDGSIVLRDTAGNTFAYVDPGDLTKINLGLAFFNAPATGTDGKLGAIIHEVTHFFLTGNTDDIRYGRDDCLRLAGQDPDSALKNADSYEYFIEDWLA